VASLADVTIENPLPGLGPGEDPELDKIVAYLKEKDPDGSRVAAALRRTIDMLLDGQHTGRYGWDQLHKTEKTHAGTLVEINLQREFDFADGDKLDYSICGIDVDCKYSQRLHRWMIPPEAVEQLLLVLWASDSEGIWSAGVVRAREDFLRTASNRDMKRYLNDYGKAAIQWVFLYYPLPENALLHMDEADVDAIFGCSRHGTKRVDELFRRAQGRRVSRNVVATVAQQDDYMKRVRGNGGSRSSLRPEGIVILGQYGGHRKIAEALHLPLPGPGESVSVRLARRRAHHGDAPHVLVGDAEWVVAQPDDPPEMAPELPDVRKPKDAG
jgi:hypothetical protein